MEPTSQGLPRSSLLVSAAAFALFFLIAWNVQQGTALPRLDLDIAEALHDHMATHPDWQTFFQYVTSLANGRPTLILGIAVAGMLILTGRRRLALFWIVTVACSGHVAQALKEVFQRPRPRFTVMFDWSFPSGHAMRAIMGYGFLAALVFLLLPRRAAFPAAATFALVALGIGFSRMYLGWHFLSDVLASFAFGIGWLALALAGIRGLGWHQSVSRDPTGERGSVRGNTLPHSPAGRG